MLYKSRTDPHLAACTYLEKFKIDRYILHTYALTFTPALTNSTTWQTSRHHTRQMVGTSAAPAWTVLAIVGAVIAEATANWQAQRKLMDIVLLPNPPYCTLLAPQTPDFLVGDSVLVHLLIC